MAQNWLIDQYGSATEISDQRYATLDGLGVIEESGSANGSDPAYVVKASADLPALSGDDLRNLMLALLSLNVTD